MTRRQKRELRSVWLTPSECKELFGATLFDPDILDAAIIAIHRPETKRGARTTELPVAVYDYDLIVNAYATMYSEDEDEIDLQAAREMATEWVDFNTLGVLPSIRERRPVIVRSADRMDKSDAVKGGIKIERRGFTYRQVA